MQYYSINFLLPLKYLAFSNAVTWVKFSINIILQIHMFSVHHCSFAFTFSSITKSNPNSLFVHNHSSNRSFIMTHQVFITQEFTMRKYMNLLCYPHQFHQTFRIIFLKASNLSLCSCTSSIVHFNNFMYLPCYPGYEICSVWAQNISTAKILGGHPLL